MAARVLTPIGLFALALAIRLLPLTTTFENGRVVFFGMDAWYHMRRVQLALANGGWPPAFDPYLNFPHGAQPIWSPLFDAMVAWLVWPVYVLGDWLAVERVAAIVPPVLGAATVLVVYRLGLRLFDRSVALVASVGLAFLSAHFWYSQVGFVDHHAAVALLSTVLLGLGARFVAVVRGERAGHVAVGGPRRTALLTGFVCGLTLLVWPGTLLHVAIVGLGLGLAWLSLDDREASVTAATRLALACVAAGVVTLPLGLSADWSRWSNFSPAVVSHFQPWLFALLAALSGGCAWLWRRTSMGATRGTRIAEVAAIALALVGVSLLAIPDLVGGAAEAWRWFTKDEVFQGLVRESLPLFSSISGPDATKAELRLSRFLYLLPLALAALVHYALSSQKRVELLLLVGWTLVLALVTLLQRRFFNSLSPAFALVMAWAVVAVVRLLNEKLRGSRVGRVAAVATTLVLCVWLLLPSLRPYALPLDNWLSVLRGEPRSVPVNELSRRGLLDTAMWIRHNTPPTDSPLDPEASPEYGLMATWGYGHLLKYAAQRPTVVGNFGDDVGETNLGLMAAYFASTEPGAVEILDDLGARYVLVGTLNDPTAELRLGQAMRKRLSLDDSPGLKHHRLVFESRLDPTWLEIGRSEYRVFERVPGAVIVGSARPGATVTARLGYESNRGRRGLFESSVAAGDQGRYEIRVPYATRGGPPGVRPDPTYRVASQGRTESVVVNERDVRAGAEIAGPHLSER